MDLGCLLLQESYDRSIERLASHLKLRGVHITPPIAAYSRFLACESLYSLYLDETCLIRRRYLSKLSGRTIKAVRELFESLGLIRIISTGEFRNKAATRIEIDTDLRQVLGIDLALGDYDHRTILRRRLRASLRKNHQDKRAS